MSTPLLPIEQLAVQSGEPGERQKPQKRRIGRPVVNEHGGPRRVLTLSMLVESVNECDWGATQLNMTRSEFLARAGHELVERIKREQGL